MNVAVSAPVLVTRPSTNTASESEPTAARVFETAVLSSEGLAPFETRDADLEAYNDAATNLSKSTSGSTVKVDTSVSERRDSSHGSGNSERIRRSRCML